MAEAPGGDGLLRVWDVGDEDEPRYVVACPDCGRMTSMLRLGVAGVEEVEAVTELAFVAGHERERCYGVRWGPVVASGPPTEGA